jgi:hypothetical protein
MQKENEVQQVLFQKKVFLNPDSRICRNVPGHGTGLQRRAANDDCYDDENSPVRVVLSVAGNVIGGTALLTGLLLLPQIVAVMLG